MSKTLFGTMPDGTPVYECTMQHNEFAVSIITYGGRIRRFVVDQTDIVCGFDNLAFYLADDSHQGALVGRYANRIDGGQFTLNGKTYQLNCNDCDSRVHLHGGPTGFSLRVWDLVDCDDTHVSLRMFSPDGDEGYPGNLTVDVTYRLTDMGLSIRYRAVSDQDTPLCLTNHAYFNLNGSGNIFDTNVTIYADAYSEINDRMIPTGHNDVHGTIFDFTTPHTIGERMAGFSGYDHNYILRATPDMVLDGVQLTRACTADNGILRLAVYTNQPCMQFYISNALVGTNSFHNGCLPAPHTAICFEAQAEPNGPNRGEAILLTGDVYTQHTVYAVEKM